MVSKHFLIAGLLGAAALFIGTDASLYARGGGGGGHGGGGGGHGGGGHGGYGGGYGRGGFGYGGGFYGGGFYGGGLFYGDYLTGGGYPGYFSPYAYPAPTPYYSYTDPIAPYSSPRLATSPSANPSYSYNYAPFTAAELASRSAVAPKSATIHVVLPDPQATVLFDGRATTSTGSDRFYHSPALTPGGSYNYQLRVTWMQDGHEVTQEKTVAVTPGQTTDVVFGRTVSEGVRAVSVVK